MAHPRSGFDKCNNNNNNYNNNNILDRSHHELQGNQADLFPFPGFTINNKNDADDRTPVTKISCGSVLNCANSAKSTEQSSSTATTKTPPVEPSVSPEMQSSLCHSVLVSGAAPSTCYGAGHVISGVIDRRKCKARGILSVGHKTPLEQDISDDNIHWVSYGNRGKDICTKATPSLIPCPVEASISWHMSPSYVDDNEDCGVVGKGDPPKGLHQSWKIVESSPSSHCSSPCTFSDPDSQGILEPSSEKVINRLSSTSPSDTPCREHVISREERPSSFDFNEECSPFSADTLGSGNVMQTPNSDTILERQTSLSWLKEGIQVKRKFESELDQVINVLQHESLSPNDNSSPWDLPRSSVDLADVSSSSNITNPNQFRENTDIHASWISNSTSENVSESQMRISWRDGLISGSFDKEDLDCCRLLSDEEMDADGLLKSPRLPGHEVRAGGNGKETSFPIQPNPCAESVCTYDGGLISSGDSDWTLYYKNRSFEI